MCLNRRWWDSYKKMCCTLHTSSSPFFTHCFMCLHNICCLIISSYSSSTGCLCLPHLPPIVVDNLALLEVLFLLKGSSQVVAYTRSSKPHNLDMCLDIICGLSVLLFSPLSFSSGSRSDGCPILVLPEAFSSLMGVIPPHHYVLAHRRSSDCYGSFANIVGSLLP